MAITLSGSTGITSPGGDVSVSQGLSGNLTFTGTGNRILGDFSNATVANRVAFQTSTTNGTTVVHALPNGTSIFSFFETNNASDPTNSAALQIGVDGTTSARISSLIRGTGTYLPMTFFTGGSERVRIDTSGNVGIGVTPSAWESTAKPIQFADRGWVGRGSSGEATLGYNYYINSSNQSIYQVSTSASRYDSQGTHRWFVAPSGTAGGVITWNQAMTLDASGNLLVGTTSAFGTSGITISSPDVSGYWSATTNTSGTNHLRFINPNGAVGSITTSGSGTTYATSSDYRLKENVAPMTGALAKVAALKPCTYTWKSSGEVGQGFIAHELQSVVPDCVTGTKDAVDAEGNPQYQGVDTSFLVATLVKAIQELKAEVDALKGAA
jgi:hypothetical protein